MRVITFKQVRCGREAIIMYVKVALIIKRFNPSVGHWIRWWSVTPESQDRSRAKWECWERIGVDLVESDCLRGVRGSPPPDQQYFTKIFQNLKINNKAFHFLVPLSILQVIVIVIVPCLSLDA